MAVALFMTLRVNVPTYDRLLQTLEWDVSPPVGEIVHLAAETPDGLEVCEIWQTRDAADGCVRDVLGPARIQLGARGPIDYAAFPLHNLCAPALDALARMRPVSRPGVAAGAIFRR